MKRYYLIALTGYVEIEADNLNQACSLALEEVQTNPHLLHTMEATPRENPRHLLFAREVVTVEGSQWSPISTAQLESYLPPQNLDDLPF